MTFCIDMRSASEKAADAMLEDHLAGHPDGLDELHHCDECEADLITAHQSGECKGIPDCTICVKAFVSRKEAIGG